MCRQKADLESNESRVGMSVCRAVCWIMNRCGDCDEGEEEGEEESGLASKAIMYL